jgi:hypothetical protein
MTPLYKITTKFQQNSSKFSRNMMPAYGTSRKTTPILAWSSSECVCVFCIIYGFASRDQCQQALQNEPEGTFLLRFSESFIAGNHIQSKAGLAVAVKNNGQSAVSNVMCELDP